MAYTPRINNSQFDSEIWNWPAFVSGDNVNFSLTIELKVHLRQQNPPNGQATARIRDADGNRVECVAWTDTDWQDFVSRYVQQVTDFWNNNFILVPPVAYNDLTYPVPPMPNGRRRNVECWFRVTTPLAARGAHVVIPVVKLADSTSFFRSHSRLYSSNDLNPDHYSSDSGRITWEFFTAPHEVGHLLGLGHSNEHSPQCQRDPDALICYGATLDQQTVVMGTGPTLSLDDARPWRNRVARHTRTRANDWQVQWASTEAAFRGISNIHLH